MTDPAHPVLEDGPLKGTRNIVYSPVFSPNGRILATGGADKLVHLWDASHPDHVVPLSRSLAGATGYLYSVIFSPDGHTLAAGGADDTVRLWDITHPHHPTLLGHPLRGPTNFVESVAYSPDGHTLAATDNAGMAWLWDTTDPAHPRLQATLPVSAGAVYDDTYDPSRDILATAGADGQVRFWDTSTSQVAAYICATVGDPITWTEWQKYLPGVPYRPPCHGSRPNNS